ncbi:hypothetical protein [Streptomyces collinus]|uniref:hypothetical protein n=1 Tax=Streptomyces collinus TaxID=42684 RepID=UPI0033E3D341
MPVIAGVAALLVGGGTYFAFTHLTNTGTGKPPASVSTSESATQPNETISQSPPAGSPEWTVKAYFDAINNGDYKRAWELGGKNLQHGSFSSFARSFEDTSYDSVTIVSVTGDTVQIELDAVQGDGTDRYFAGTYAVHDGVIAAADIHEQ